MSSEIEQFFFSAMPNSDLFLIIKDNPEDVAKSLSSTSHSPITFDSLLLKSSSKLKDLSSNHSHSQIDQNDNSQSHSQAKKEEEDDGFRTPTSLDHKIPEAKHCPPAPRKPKPKPSLKRKSHHTHTLTSPPLYDLSKEIEMLLFPFQHNPLSNSHQITKKVRRDGPN